MPYLVIVEANASAQFVLTVHTNTPARARGRDGRLISLEEIVAVHETLLPSVPASLRHLPKSCTKVWGQGHVVTKPVIDEAIG